MRTHVEKTAGQAIKGAGVPALPRNLKPRYCGNSGTQVTGGSSHVLCSFMDYQALRSEILESPRSSGYEQFAVASSMPKQRAGDKDRLLADAINANPDIFNVITTRPIKRGDFIKKLGPISGSSLLTKIKTAAANYDPLLYVVMELDGDGLVISDSSMFSIFIVDIEEKTALDSIDIKQITKVFSEKKMISASDVSIALRGNAEFNPGV